MAAEERSQLTIDLDAVWAALVRSKQLNDLLDRISQEIAEEAASIARSVAFDTGYYADSFWGGAVDAGTVRNFANATEGRNSDRGAGVNRRRRGQRGKNKYLDWQQSGSEEPPTSYDGRLGIVTTDSKVAVLIEYGSIANSPQRVLWTACERVADRYGLETEVLWTRFHDKNSAELSAKQKAGKARAKANKPAPAPESGGES